MRADAGRARRGLGAPPGRFAAALLLGLGAAAPGAARAQPAGDPPRQPFLRVEAGAHTAPVARIAADARGDLLASVSDDKTLRLWSVSDGAPRGVLRLPIGPAEEGELYAVALSPDGTRAYAGGFTGHAWDGAFAVYVFDTTSKRMTHRLPGLPAPVGHLAVSPDGSRLAAALRGRAGVRVWDAATGRVVFQDASGFEASARTVAFDASGARLAATAADGRVRLYDASGRRLAERTPLAGARPFGVAWSPDGTLLAVGYEDRLRVDVLSAADLRTVLTPDAGGLRGGGLPAVAWAGDGRGGVQLYAGGDARRAAAAQPAGGPEFVVRRWVDFGLGPPADVPAARDAVFQLVPLPTGGVAFAAADPGWGRLAPDGTLALTPDPPSGDLRATGAALAASPDGTRVRFALRSGAAPLVFDAAWGRLQAAARDEAFVDARPASPRLPVVNWHDGAQPRLGATPLRLEPGELSRRAAVLPGDGGVLLGTSSHLRLYDATGRPLDSLPTPGAVWGLVAPGGGVAVAALGDGTIRWYDAAVAAPGAGGRLRERGALFVHADARRWVLWTPDGLFDHAAQGGQDLVGVHLNGGRAQTPEWASFAQAYRALYAPAAVRARLGGDPAPGRERLAALGDVRQRIGRAPVLRGTSACAVTAEACRPVAWGAAAAVLPPGARALRLSFAAEDRGLGLGPLDVMVNERIAARAALAAGEAAVEVPLDPGENRVATRLYAGDGTLFAEGPGLDLRRAGDPAPPPPGAGRLVVLAVGVDGYADPLPDLGFAVADARAVAEALRAGGRGLFRDVAVTLLTDGQATRRGILDALAAAAAAVAPEDTFVLYLAGHGLRTEPDRRFLFVPSDVSDASSLAAIRRQALEEDALVAALARVRARDGFLFVDTCHAGQVTLDSLAAIGNETGRFLLAASTSVQEALDSYDGENGVFAHAVREGLRGRAAVDGEGRVSALALGEWVARRVPALAAERRHRQDAVFRTARRDLRSFPLAVVERRAGE